MLSRSIVVISGLLIGFGSAGVVQPAAAQGYSQEQQQLCSGDAFRLCGPDIPDVDRVTACMVRQRAQLSPGCQSVFRPADIAPPVPVRVGRPINVRPKAVRAGPKASKAKAATQRKAKKSAS